MDKLLQEFLKRECVDFERELQAHWGVGSRFFQSNRPTFRDVYKRYLSLACTASVVSRRRKAGAEYAGNLVECGYLSLVLAVKGAENPAFVLLRQSIELVLKLIYFTFHPVEYTWVCSREGTREPTYASLLEFIRQTDEHRSLRIHNNVCDRIDQVYGVLSRYVHIHSQAFAHFGSLPYRSTAATKVVGNMNKRTRELWPLLTMLLVIFFPEKVRVAQENERKLIFSSFDKTTRGILHKHCSLHSTSRYYVK